MPWELIGHEAAVRHLRDALARERLAHAYLFTGPPGVGKTALATALAQAVNCPSPEPPCLGCSSCRRVAAGRHPDVVRLALEGSQREMSIDRIEEIQKLAALRAFEGPWRVFIIEEAQGLSHPAANRLLKTLEEPPPNTLFILTSSADDRLLTTIRSRCQLLQLHRVPATRLAAALAQRFGLGLDEAMVAVALAQGRPGAAITIATQPERLDQAAEDIDRLKAILEAPLPERLEAAGTLVEGPEGNRNAAQQVLSRWEPWWRDLLLMQQGCETGLVYLHERGTYRSIAPRLTAVAVREGLRAVQEAQRQLEHDALPRLVLEVVALRLPILRPDSTAR